LLIALVNVVALVFSVVCKIFFVDTAELTVLFSEFMLEPSADIT
jgi:hypothetical protein